MSLTRRRFVVLGLGSAAALSVGATTLAACSGTAEVSTPEVAPLPDVDGLDAIGVAYVRTTSDDTSRTAIAAALGLAAPSDAGTPFDPEALLAERATSIRGDFATGDVVELDGWVLSRTEVRIAALSAYESGVLDG